MPEGYLKAASLLGISPQDCIVIEDAPPGIEAGRTAQATVIGVATTYPPTALREASICIPNLTNLVATTHYIDQQTTIKLLITGTV